MEVLAYFVSNAKAFKQSRRKMVGKYEFTCSRRPICVQRIRQLAGVRCTTSRNTLGIKRTRWFRMPHADATRNFDAARFQGLFQCQSSHLARVAHGEVEFDGRMDGRN